MIVSEDPRIRTFPFPTRRPTQAELIRCFTELTRIKLSYLTIDELKQLDEAYRIAMAPPPPSSSKKPSQQLKEKEKPEIVKLTKEELLERDRWERIVDMVKKGRLEVFKSFLEKQQIHHDNNNNDEDDENSTSNNSNSTKNWIGKLPDWMEEAKTCPTLLHVAASNDQPDLVRYLLIDQKADPTLSAFITTASSAPDSSLSADEIPSLITTTTTTRTLLPPSRTAYECSASRSVLNIFRRAFADNPTRCDWINQARVPSPLTEEMESLQINKKNERNSKLKDKLKERQLERERDNERLLQEEKENLMRIEQEEKIRREKEEAKKLSNSKTPKRLGGAAPKNVLDQTVLKGLSEEAKMRIEREKRAKAAEARLQGR